MSVKIVIREDLYIKSPTLDLEKALVEENTIPNPKRAKLLAMFKDYLREGAEQDIPEGPARRKFKTKVRRIRFMIEAEPERFVLWEKRQDWLAIPRGCFAGLISRLRQTGEQFEIDDRTVFPPAPMIAEAGNLYSYQELALRDLMRYQTGVLEAPTGSGKTNVLLSIAARLQTPVLIVVHTTELMRQTIERAKSWLRTDAGRIGGGKKDKINQITVAMIQTLMRRNLREDPIRDYFGAVIVDECHHAPAESYAHVLRQLPARHKYGVTATAWRKDQLQFLMWKVIGNRTAAISTGTVQAAGKIVWPRIEWVLTEYWYDAADTSEWTRMITDLVGNTDRNDLIQREVRKRIGDSRALILTDRIDHANRLSAILADLDPVLLTGEIAKGGRSERMDLVRNGARLTIATVHLLGEGIDVPGWDLLFLVSPISGGPRTLQAMGRIARPAPGKTEAVLVDFVDARVKLLKGAALSRAKIYKGR